MRSISDDVIISDSFSSPVLKNLKMLTSDRPCISHFIRIHSCNFFSFSFQISSIFFSFSIIILFLIFRLFYTRYNLFFFFFLYPIFQKFFILISIPFFFCFSSIFLSGSCLPYFLSGSCLPYFLFKVVCYPFRLHFPLSISFFLIFS